MKKVAVVTGSNKGIGYGIVRGLCKQFDGDVYLTSRDVQRGAEAVKTLEGEGLHAKYHQLDVCDKSSIEKLKQHLLTTYQGIDVLVNNAGISYTSNSTTPFAEQAEVTIRTNYTALIDVCDVLFPILKPGARVVHLSSMLSTVVIEKSPEHRVQSILVMNKISEVSDMVAEFVEAAKNGKHKDNGWIESAVGVSKLGVLIAAYLQQKEFDKDTNRPDIVVNACCPGFVSTDMTEHRGHLTVEQGADTPTYLALLPPNVEEPKGDFVKERKIYKWRDGQYPVFKKS